MSEPAENRPAVAVSATNKISFATTDSGTRTGLAGPDGTRAIAAADRDLRQTAAYRVFVGSQGLRAGWSMLVFLAILVLLFTPVQFAIAHQFHLTTNSAHPAAVMATEAASLLVVMLATLVMARIEKRPLLSYGFSGDRKLPRFLWGIFMGVAALSALVAVLKFAGLLSMDGLLLHGLLAWEYGLAWGAGFLLVALFEESLLRGYVQFTLARGIGFWWATLLLSAGFGLLHLSNHGESVVGIFSAAAIGVVFCLSLWLTKSLWWAVGMHAGWDWAQSYLYGVADSGMTITGHLYASHPVGALLWSGGPTGPEGSLYVVPLLLIVGGGVWLTLKPRQYHADGENAAEDHFAA